MSVPAHAGIFSDPFNTESRLNRDTAGLNDPLSRDCVMPAGALTFAAAANLALCKNPQTRSAWATAHEQAASLGSTESEWLPSLSGTASRNRTTGDHADVNGNIVSVSQYSTDAALNLTWLIYDFGGRTSRTDNAKSLLDAAAYTASFSVQQLLLQVVQDYYGAVAADALLASAKKTEEETKRTLEIARALASGGASSLGDVLQAQTAYQQAVLASVQADQGAKAARGTLAVGLGVSADQVFKLESDAVPTEVPALSARLTSLMSEAVAQRPDLKAAQAQRDAAAASVTSAQAQGRPSISFGAIHSYTDTQGVQNQNYNQIGVSVNVPLFTGFKVHYDVRQARAALKVQDINVDQVGLTVTLDVWTSYYALDSAVQQLSVTGDLVKTAATNLEVAMGQYQAGLVSILDVLTAQVAEASARQQRIQAELGWWVARAQMARSVGRLTSAEPLKGVDAMQ